MKVAVLICVLLPIVLSKGKSKQRTDNSDADKMAFRTGHSSFGVEEDQISIHRKRQKTHREETANLSSSAMKNSSVGEGRLPIGYKRQKIHREEMNLSSSGVKNGSGGDNSVPGYKRDETTDLVKNLLFMIANKKPHGDLETWEVPDALPTARPDYSVVPPLPTAPGGYNAAKGRATKSPRTTPVPGANTTAAPGGNTTASPPGENATTPAPPQTTKPSGSTTAKPSGGSGGAGGGGGTGGGGGGTGGGVGGGGTGGGGGAGGGGTGGGASGGGTGGGAGGGGGGGTPGSLPLSLCCLGVGIPVSSCALPFLLTGCPGAGKGQGRASISFL